MRLPSEGILVYGPQEMTIGRSKLHNTPVIGKSGEVVEARKRVMLVLKQKRN